MAAMVINLCSGYTQAYIRFGYTKDINANNKATLQRERQDLFAK